MCGYEDIGSCAVLHYPRAGHETLSRVCQGRHCLHDWECNRWTYTINGV